MLTLTSSMLLFACLVTEETTYDPAESDPTDGDQATSDINEDSETDDGLETEDKTEPEDIDETEETADTGHDESGEPVDYSQTGPHSVTVSTDTVSLSGACTMAVTEYASDGSDGPVLILAHGFSRGQAQMADWANHVATWGVRVITPALCHANILDADHELNGEEMVALNNLIGSDEVIYGGQSAGGLAAFVAGYIDPNAVAVIGLDMTDSDGLAMSVASKIDAQVYGLLGEPSSCNSESNGLSAYQQVADAVTVRVTEADHCDFESPTDFVCTLLCPGTNNQYSDESIRQVILGMMTAAVVDAANLGSGVDDWWLPQGVFYDEHVSDGNVQGL